MPPMTLSRQIELLAKYVRAMTVADLKDIEQREKVLKWVRDIPPAGRPKLLLEILKQRLVLTDEQLTEALKAKKGIDDVELLVPKEGWLKDYIEYTRNTEPPTIFHLFAGMSAIGASLARSVFFDMGAYQIYPNLCTIIVAPTGRCRKTSACNIAMGLYRAIGGNVLADRATPEALIGAFTDQTSATGLVYAPELAVFLGKQKYQEGMVPLLTALFDCPKEWSSLTIMRGQAVLKNVAISFLACSTMDWIQTAIPRDAYGGGFMSRLLFVVQNDTPRSFAHPPPFNADQQLALKTKLMGFTKLRGQFTISKEADDWYVDWYSKKYEIGTGEKQFAGYIERRPDHLHRIAMILGVAEMDPKRDFKLELSLRLLKHSLAILSWLEGHLPAAFSEMSQTPGGEESAKLLKQLQIKGGQMSHSEWLRMNTNRMNRQQFREIVHTLREANLISYDAVLKGYFLTPEGWSK